MSQLRRMYAPWFRLNETLAQTVSGLSPEQLATQPTPSQWPLWATVGHLACQRVFWLCDFAGEPGADTTRFTNAGYDCPGDDDLVNVLGPSELVEALRSTFVIVERCLDTWSIESLDEAISRPEFGPDRAMKRGVLLTRTHQHDAWHAAQVSQTLSANDWGRIDVWV